jgi:hypothetical protein
MGMKFNFIRIFSEFFGPRTVKTRSNLYSNNQIHIQTIKFKFKQTNQDLTTTHRLPWQAVAPGRYRPTRPQRGQYRLSWTDDSFSACSPLYVTSSRR